MKQVNWLFEIIPGPGNELRVYLSTPQWTNAFVLVLIECFWIEMDEIGEVFIYVFIDLFVNSSPVLLEKHGELASANTNSVKASWVPRANGLNILFKKSQTYIELLENYI